MAPVLTSLAPSSGPTSVFNTVVITGSGFSNVGPLTVRFGTAATTFTIDSNTQITAVAPPGTGTVNVTVTVELDGTSNPLPYTYVAAPTLTSIAPNTGPVVGGTTVVLTGTNLTGATAVSFGATPATSFVVNSATQITAVAPAGTAGTVPVTATTVGGTSNGVSYTYV